MSHQPSGKRVILLSEVIGGTWETLDKWGFRSTASEDAFKEVELPSGWSLASQPDGEGNRQELIDTQQRIRAIYFNDSQQLALCKRYDWDHRSAPTQFQFRSMHWYEVINADGRVLFKTNEIADPKPEATQHATAVFEDMRHKSAKQAQDWLDKNYPDWEDATAYWD